jgi:hypothetical protein
MSDRKNKLVMMVVFDDLTGGRHGYGHVRCYAKSEFKWRQNYESPGYGSDLEHLKVSCQTDPDHLVNYASKTYAWTAEWESGTHDLDQCERGVKILRKIKRELGRFEAEDGRCDTFGRYVLRVCRALKIKEMVFVSLASCPSGYKYRDSELRYGMTLIDARIDEWAEKYRPVPATA